MTLRIDLTPEEEARLEQAAAHYGLATGEYVRPLIQERTEYDEPVPKRRRKAARRADTTGSRRAEEWDRIVDETPEDLPLISDAALRRENLYQERI